jgi:hypothetical protein
MAHIIKLKYGSPSAWSYINLTDAYHGNVDYFPGTPAQGAEDISESGRWRIKGTGVHPVTDMQARIAEIERVFYMAGDYDADHVGDYRAWVTVQLDGTSEVWESEIFEGRVELTGNVLGVDWANRETDVVIVWRRAAWWEKLTRVPCSNSNGTGAVSDLAKVYNGGDSSGSAPTKRENWVDVAAADVAGDLAAPTVIYVKHLSPPGPTIDNLMAFANAKAYVAGTFLAEGETGTGDTVDAARSGGKYKDYVTPVGGTTGVYFVRPASDLDTVRRGAWLRFVLSAKFTGTVYATPYFTAGMQRYFGPKSVIVGTGTDFFLYDLGMVHFIDFSPNLDADIPLGVISVGVNFIAASAITVSVDYLTYTPVDSYLRGTLNYRVDTETILDSRYGQIAGSTSVIGSSSPNSYGTLYGGISLLPGMAQRIFFKETLAGKDLLSTGFSIEIYAYLRKRTL